MLHYEVEELSNLIAGGLDACISVIHNLAIRYKSWVTCQLSTLRYSPAHLCKRSRFK